MFLAQYTCSCKRSCLAAVHLMKLRYFKAISRIHSKLANLKVNTYQFHRCVTLTPPVFICQNKGTFGYTVLYKHPNLAVLYMNWFPLQMSKILWIILCSHQSYLKEKLPFMLHLVLKESELWLQFGRLCATQCSSLFILDSSWCLWPVT